jgi:two-component SAPR family response regulator
MMKVRVFILEDDVERVAAFHKVLKKRHACDIYHTDKIDKAKDLLKNNQFDLIFLDHDLGGKIFVDSAEETGYQVAKFIAQNGIKCHQIIVHSMNPVGAKNMMDVLEKFSNTVHIPFPVLIQHLESEIR